MLIRKAIASDIPALSRLIPESARALSQSYYTPEQIEGAVTNIFGLDTMLIADSTYYVVEADGSIVGCGGWSKRKTLYGGDQAKSPEVDALLDPETEPARIRAFFVHPDWGRRGIGSKIMTVCETDARQAGFTNIELVATLPGEPLYAAFGYVAIERFEIPLPDGITLPVARMKKRIAQQGDD